MMKAHINISAALLPQAGAQDFFANLTDQKMAGEVVKQTTRRYKERNHRFSSLPVKDVVRIRMKDLGIKNGEMQAALDYPRPNVIAMVKGGSMRLPASKAVAAAKLLQVDPVFLLGKAIAESDPALWDTMSPLLGDRLVTANELKLLDLVRRELDGHDIDLTSSPRLIREVQALLKPIVKKEKALTQATLNRMDD
jgi:hypothetical protein